MSEANLTLTETRSVYALSVSKKELFWTARWRSIYIGNCGKITISIKSKKVLFWGLLTKQNPLLLW
jgi:hypothetical protein